MSIKAKTWSIMFIIGVFLFSVPVQAIPATKLHVVLVLDISSSMKNNEKPYKVVEAVHDFIEQLPDNESKLSVVAFTGGYDIIADNYILANNQDYHTDILDALSDKIDHYNDLNEGLNGTVIANAMKQGDTLLAHDKNNGEYLTAMLLYTDAINSGKAPVNEADIINDFNDGKYGNYPIYVIELPTRDADSRQGEKKMDLKNLGDNNGGIWIQELNIANVPDHFKNVAEKLVGKIQIETADIPSHIGQPTDNHDEASAQPTKPNEPVSQMVISEIEIISLPKNKMLNDQEIIIQGSLKTRSGNSLAVIVNEEAYQDYQAKLYIKNEVDKEFRVSDMDISGGSYKTRYMLPVGVYSFYIEIWQNDTLIQTSASDTITVLTADPPGDISLAVSSEGTLSQSIFDNQTVSVTLTAKLQDEDKYNDTLYYERYNAALLISHNGNLVEKIAMDADNQSYVADYSITETGKYVFQVELLIDATTGSRMESVVKMVNYRKLLPIPILCAELVAALSIAAFIYAKRDIFFPRAYVGHLQYTITDILGNSTAYGIKVLKSYMGRLTLKDVLCDDCSNMFDNEWLAAVQIKPVSNGITVAVRGNIKAELKTTRKTMQKKKLLLQDESQLILTIGDYKAILKYTTN